MQKKLIINADDYGMSPFWNRGILKLARKKIITSISVMIKKKWISASDFNNLKDVSIGLHLELKDNCNQKEIEHQIALFKKKFNFFPSHIDSHKHFHLKENNINKVIYIIKKYQPPMRSFSAEKRRLIRDNNIKTPDNFIGWHPNEKEFFLKELSESNYSITELVCHPGYYDKNCDYPYNKQREKELNILESKEFKAAIKNYQLITYKDL